MKKTNQYKQAKKTIPETHQTWPLYGSGLEKLGYLGKPVEAKVPTYNQNELLARIDAVSLCFSDVKQIKLGNKHPRLLDRNLQKNPIVPGHEVSLTIVGVGEELASKYKIGDRYTLQPDIWFKGKSIPFCHGIDGGYRQYTKVGKEILHGDAGNYLITIPDEMSYTAAALTEPWACVEAAYRMEYRDHLLDKGSVWLIGCEKSRQGYKLGDLLEQVTPREVVLTNLPEDIMKQVKDVCNIKKIPVSIKELNEVLNSEQLFDDVLVLDCSSVTVTQASKKMNKGAVLAILCGKPAEKTIEIDLGRLHYDNIYFVGTITLNLADAYKQTDPRVTLKTKGVAWILGAGGPMGRMHLQRAIEAKNGPDLIVASEVTEDRFESLKDFFLPMAEQHQKELIVVNPKGESQRYSEVMNHVMEDGGVDDLEVMVAVVPVIAESLQYLAEKGVVNLFAGLKRGVCVEVDQRLIYGPKQVRFVGHSGSALDDQRAVVEKAISGELKPELSVAAVGGFNQIVGGIQAMKNWLYPGKIVIFPHVLDFPLTAISEFKEKDPDIYNALGKGETWTKEAEEIFLEKGLS